MVSSHRSVDVECAIDVGAAFHVHPDQPVQLSRCIDERTQVALGHVLAQVEAELGQLDGDFNVERSVLHPGKSIQINLDDGRRFGFLVDILAKQREQGPLATLGQGRRLP
ncbi:MAG: hypothetical protein IH991_14630, partial [Planctomycetes bacterium]|nr:hypothetical protein [Planctomycetota bacterium]